MAKRKKTTAESDQLLSLLQVAEHPLVRRADGRSLQHCTVYRWVAYGLLLPNGRKLRLPTVQASTISRQRLVKLSDLEEFVAKIAAVRAAAREAARAAPPRA
jgi:hypothetical protein